MLSTFGTPGPASSSIVPYHNVSRDSTRCDESPWSCSTTSIIPNLLFRRLPYSQNSSLASAKMWEKIRRKFQRKLAVRSVPAAGRLGLGLPPLSLGGRLWAAKEGGLCDVVESVTSAGRLASQASAGRMVGGSSPWGRHHWRFRERGRAGEPRPRHPARLRGRSGARCARACVPVATLAPGTRLGHTARQPHMAASAPITPPRFHRDPTHSCYQ